jgi:pimeloyl-ACP methyl ester carboxylesterase
VAANARALADFLREQVKEPCILVGNSMGGYISIMVAAQHPDLVSGLVLIDPALPLARGARLEPAVGKQFFLHGVPGLGEWLLARRYARVPARQRVTEVMERCCHDLTRVSPDLLEQLIALEEELTGQPRHAADHLAAARSIVRGLARPATYWRLAGRVERPVLLVHGTHDRLISIASAYQAAKLHPHWTFVELEAGHVPMMETPDLVAKAIITWLDEIA